jgi:hypothetical protein
MNGSFVKGQWSWIALLVLGAAAPCAWASSNYANVVLGDMPVGYWRLGESQTTPVAADISGNARNGTYTRSVVSGATGAIVGDPDTAATFDGSTTGVDVPNTGGSDQFTLTNGFSLEAWVINAGQTGTARAPLGRIVSNGWPGMIGYGWGILASPPDAMRFTTYGVLDYDSTLTVVPQDGNWHHVVVVFDSTNTANFYLDGVNTDSIPGPGPAHTAALDLMIGRNPASAAEEFFNGSIDEVAIYNYELDPVAQIQNHYKVGTSP